MSADRPPSGDSEPLTGAGLQSYGYRSAEVSLDKAAAEKVSVVDQLALRDQALRESMADRVMRAFLLANALTLGGIGVLWLADELNMVFHVTAPGERIITSRVIMALIGATTVQVGTIAVIIARYLFPRR